MPVTNSQEVEVLSKGQIDRLTKDELQKYANNLSKEYKKLYDRLFDENNGIIQRLESQLAVSTNINNHLVKKVIELEKASNNNAQYARKETIELRGFDPNINDKEIEGKVLHIINSIKEDNTLVL